MDKKEFCGFVEGFLATTHVDSHGDKLTLALLKDMKRNIDTNPEMRKMNLNHEEGNYIGEILETKIVDDGEFQKLWAHIGIYNEKENILRMFETGELKGFSWEGFTNQKDFDNSNIKIEVSGEHHHKIEKILEENGIEYTVNFKKSADALTIIGVIMTSLGTFLSALGIILNFKKQTPTMIVNININGSKFEINEINTEKIIKLLKEAK